MRGAKAMNTGSPYSGDNIQPPSQLDQLKDGNAAVSKPLAVTQEDCLVVCNDIKIQVTYDCFRLSLRLCTGCDM